MIPITRLYRRKLLLSSSIALLVLSGVQLSGLIARWSSSLTNMSAIALGTVFVVLGAVYVVQAWRGRKVRPDDDEST